MGQKVHPYGLRVGYIYDWKSRWFAKKGDFPKLVLEDSKIRKFVKKALSSAAVSKIDIERSTDKVSVLIYSARPGIIIGRRGSEMCIRDRKFPERMRNFLIVSEWKF